MQHLCDSNVLIALTVKQHQAHAVARAWLGTLISGDKLGLCRMCEMSYLRLLTQKIAEGYSPVTNEEAAGTLLQWKDKPFVEQYVEPEGMQTTWLRLAGIGQPAPKIWMDAYLAAFAIHSGKRLVTLDGDFEKYRSEGLDVLLLRTGKAHVRP